MGRDDLVPSRVSGEAILALARWGRPRPPLPAGAWRVPGPHLIAAAWLDGPDGPSIELTIAALARVRWRLRWVPVFRAIDAPWADPRLRAHFVWERDGEVREMRWADEGLSIVGKSLGLAWPLSAPVQLGSLPARCRRLKGRCTVAQVRVDVKQPGLLAQLEGRHLGLLVKTPRVLPERVRANVPARAPARLTPVFAPLNGLVHAPSQEPALPSSSASRAIGSVG